MEVGCGTKGSNQISAYQEIDRTPIKDEMDNNILLATHQQHINDNTNFLDDTLNRVSTYLSDQKDSLIIKEEKAETDINEDLDSFKHNVCKIEIKEEIENNIVFADKMNPYVISTYLTKIEKDDEHCSDRDDTVLNYSFEHVDCNMEAEEDFKHNIVLTNELIAGNVGESSKTEKVDLHDANLHTKTTRTETAFDNVTSTRRKSHVCDVCNKQFSYKNALKGHRRIHTGQKPYVCDVCNKAFTQMVTLKNHKLIHTGEKSYVCEECNRAFRRLDALNKHKLTHTDYKPYACDVCKKEFTRPENLRQHKFIHTNEYQCEVCDKTFSRLLYLQQHKLIHTGEKQYDCHVCNKGFSTTHNLVSHIRTLHDGLPPEKEYVCDVCFKAFPRLNQLKQHKVIHTGIKPHVCDFCNKAFVNLNKLTRHKFSHTGEKPYVCNVCNKAFGYKTSLVKHKFTICVPNKEVA